MNRRHYTPKLALSLQNLTHGLECKNWLSVMIHDTKSSSRIKSDSEFDSFLFACAFFE